MKTILVLLSFFLFAFATVSFPRAVDAQDSLPLPPVLDVFGNKVIAGSGYYIYSALNKKPIIGATMGIDYNVVLSDANLVSPLPVIMSSASKDEYVHLGTQLNIKFDYDNQNNVSTIWMIAFSAYVPGYTVRIGGDESDKFQIVKHGADENVYALTRCFPPLLIACYEIGNFSVGSSTFLIPSAKPFPIVFSPVKPLPALVDVFGNKVIAGSGYYIYSAFDKNIGATVGINNNIVLVDANLVSPLPVTMSSASHDEYVRLGTDLNIKFDYDIQNNVSTIWRVGFNPWVRGDSVMIGGDESDRFYFEKHGADENVYALIHCLLPSRIACQGIGDSSYVIFSNPITFLIPSKPFPFVFSPVKLPLISSE